MLWVNTKRTKVKNFGEPSLIPLWDVELTIDGLYLSHIQETTHRIVLWKSGNLIF